MNNAIGIIGFGTMGSAIAGGLAADYRVFVFEKDAAKTAGVSGIQAVSGIRDLADKADAMILAVKPQDFEPVLHEVRTCPGIIEKLIISIAAGISTAYIEKNIGIARVIRAMPNLPAKIGQGVTCLAKGTYATEDDFDFAENLFDYVGETLRIEEDMMDAATAISGSGPGYIFYDLERLHIDPAKVTESMKREYVERLKRAAQKVGFDLQTAATLAAATTGSSLGMASAAGIPPAALKQQVASKGGTTEAALKILTAGGSWEEAALAARDRARELSKGYHG